MSGTSGASKIELKSPIFVFGEPLIELSSVEGDTARLGVGGDTFNTSVYLARAGVDVQYVTAIGDDPISNRVLEALKDEGIGTDYVSIMPGQPVGLYSIEVDDVGERSFTYWRSASAFRSWFQSPSATDTLRAMAEANTIYLSGISLSVFTTQERHQLIDMLGQARANGAQIAFDTNYRPRGWPSASVARDTIDAIKPFVTVSLPTFEDEEELFGSDAPQSSVSFWHEAGCAEVCVKSGPKGALLSDGQWVVPEILRQPKDTTGAGDSFNGAYLAARLQNQSPAEAARAGNDLAGRVIMTRGAILPR